MIVALLRILERYEYIRIGNLKAMKGNFAPQSSELFIRACATSWHSYDINTTHTASCRSTHSTFAGVNVLCKASCCGH